MKNLKLSLIICILLYIPIIAISVSATSQSYNRYALQEYLGSGSSDTYSVRASNLGGIFYYAPTYSRCIYSAGTQWGVYPEVVSSGGFWYGGLIFPASASLKLIGANCTEVDNYPIDGTIKATMGYINRFIDELPKYVLLMQRSNGTWAIDYFSIDNETSLFYLYHSKNLGFTPNGDYIDGLACGCSSKIGACAFSDSACFFADTTTDNVYKISNSNYSISTYPTGHNLQSDVGIPFGALVDFDSDGLNEFVVSNVYGDDGNIINVEWYSMGFNGVLEHWASVESHSFGTGGTVIRVVTNPKQLYSYPCQIGGVTSEMEICVNVAVNQAGGFKMVYEIFDNSDTSIFNNTKVDIDKYPFTMAIADLNYDGFKDFCYPKKGTDKYFTCVSGEDSSTEIFDYILDNNVVSDTNYFQTFMINMDNNESEQELIFSNGDVLDLATGTFQKKFDTSLGNGSDGYLVVGDLNHDDVDDLIYSDTGITYIYSTNHEELPLMNFSATTTSTTTTTTIGGGGTTTTTTTTTTLLILSCNETDGGDIPDIYGEVTWNFLIYTYIFPDTCGGIYPFTILEESFCNGTDYQFKNYTCPDRDFLYCNSGVCSNSTPITTTTTTTTTTTILTAPLSTPQLEVSASLVDVSNPASAIDTSDNSTARGLLPDIYFGISAFMRAIFIPFIVILIAVMFCMVMFLILKKVSE